jgi:hypothetical protein
MGNEEHSVSTRGKYLVFVDDQKYSEVVLKVACSKARAKNNPVELLFVINPSEYNSIFAVGDRMKKERREEVEAFLDTMAAKVKKQYDIIPSINIREGDTADEIISCIDEQHDISMLVMSSSPASASGGGKLLTSIISELDDTLHIPMMIVPPHLTTQQIQELSK